MAPKWHPNGTIITPPAYRSLQKDRRRVTRPLGSADKSTGLPLLQAAVSPRSPPRVWLLHLNHNSRILESQHEGNCILHRRRRNTLVCDGPQRRPKQHPSWPGREMRPDSHRRGVRKAPTRLPCPVLDRILHPGQIRHLAMRLHNGRLCRHKDGDDLPNGTLPGLYDGVSLYHHCGLSGDDGNLKRVMLGQPGS